MQKEFIYYCECGAAFKYYPSCDKNTFSVDVVAIKTLVQSHKDAGHEEVSAQIASTIRQSYRDSLRDFYSKRKGKIRIIQY